MEEKIAIRRVVEILKKSRSILFITGAGISADSGLPTYRGIGGLYNDKTTDEGIPIETALAGETLKTNPEVTWKYLSQIEERTRGARFNRAHEIIAEMDKHFQRLWILTQNIDGFHNDAGSKNVIDIHGDIHNLLCPQCRWRKTIKDFTEIEIPPTCPECGAIARPDVVFFGEILKEKKLRILCRELNIGFDSYFSIGTTSVFPYISGPITDANSRGLATVEINPCLTEISSIVDVKISLPAAKALEIIWAEFFN